MGVDQNTQQGQPQVRPTAQKKDPIDVQQEKELFLNVRPELVDTNHPLTSRQVRAMSKQFEQLIMKHPMKNVNNLK